jgi:hypothetical protein
MSSTELLAPLSNFPQADISEFGDQFHPLNGDYYLCGVPKPAVDEYHYKLITRPTHRSIDITPFINKKKRLFALQWNPTDPKQIVGASTDIADSSQRITIAGNIVTFMRLSKSNNDQLVLLERFTIVDDTLKPLDAVSFKLTSEPDNVQCHLVLIVTQMLYTVVLVHGFKHGSGSGSETKYLSCVINLQTTQYMIVPGKLLSMEDKVLSGNLNHPLINNIGMQYAYLKHLNNGSEHCVPIMDSRTKTTVMFDMKYWKSTTYPGCFRVGYDHYAQGCYFIAMEINPVKIYTAPIADQFIWSMESADKSLTIKARKANGLDEYIGSITPASLETGETLELVGNKISDALSKRFSDASYSYTNDTANILTLIVTVTSRYHPSNYKFYLIRVPVDQLTQLEKRVKLLEDSV